MSTYDYGKYADDSNDDNSGSSDSDNDRDAEITLIMTPNATIEANINKAFGNENRFGRSLGLVWKDVELVDGVLYYDSDKDNHKVFSWREAIGVSPDEADDLSADDANQYLMKTYGTTEKRYELVEAVVPGDDPVSIGNAIIWSSGTREHGPNAVSLNLSKLLTRDGVGGVVEEEDWYDGLSEAEQAVADDADDTSVSWLDVWMKDVSGDNLLRSDLQDRRVAFFTVKKDSESSDRKYHSPIVIDTTTGSRVTRQNNSDSAQGTLADDADESEGEETADEEETADDVPEPIADFVSTCDSIGFTDPDRASTLLNDLVEDDGNDLTAEMLDEFGGVEAALGLVVD